MLQIQFLRRNQILKVNFAYEKYLCKKKIKGVKIWKYIKGLCRKTIILPSWPFEDVKPSEEQRKRTALRTSKGSTYSWRSFVALVQLQKLPRDSQLGLKQK